MGSTVILDLMGGVALLLWGLHMVHSGVVRAFGADLRRLLGLALKGKVYSPNTAELLDMLNFVGDLGTGLLYVLARFFDIGQASVQIAIADYGTKFIVVAGLLNIISAVDAHSLATGRKRS